MGRQERGPLFNAKKTADIIIKVMDLNIGRQRGHLRLARWVKPTQITFKSRERSPAEVREKQQKGISERNSTHFC